MSGRLTVNKITNCSDLTIRMDKATIVGNYSSLEINDISNSKGTKITMTDMKVMTTDQYYREKAGRGYVGGSSYGGAVKPGSLVVNRVVDSHATTINQNGMSIGGRFDDVRINDVARSTKTDISMKGAKINIEANSDSEEDSSDFDEGIPPTDDMDVEGGEEEELPKPSTYEYYIADKFTFNIRLGRGANVTCTFLQRDKVKNVKTFVTELQPNFEGKEFRLELVDEPGTYVDEEPEMTLKDAKFRDKLELRCVIL